LKDHFFVEVIFSYLYEAQRCETYKTMEILGTVENVLMAEYIYYFLLNQLEVLWKDHQLKTGDQRNRNRRSYWLGVLDGFSHKLNQMGKKSHIHFKDAPQSKTTSALVCAQDKKLFQFMRNRFPRLRSYRSQSGMLDHGTYRAGIHDGKRLTIYRGVTGNRGYKGKLLTV